MNTDRDESLFKDAEDKIFQLKKSNSEAYNKAILTLSSAGLGLSLSLNKSLVSLDLAKCIYLIQSTWWLFLVAIVSTVISFKVGNIGLDKSRENSIKYYLQGKDEYRNKANPIANISRVLDCVSGIAFISAITCLILFVSENMK